MEHNYRDNASRIASNSINGTSPSVYIAVSRTTVYVGLVEDCAVAATDKDSIQAYVSDPCRCSCFFHCHKVDNEWTVPPEPQCCPPCTFWSSVNRACIRVLDGCDEVKPKEDNKTKTETEKQKNSKYCCAALECSSWDSLWRRRRHEHNTIA